MRRARKATGSEGDVLGLGLQPGDNSVRSFAGSELRDMMSIGPVESIEIGSKSFSGS